MGKNLTKIILLLAMLAVPLNINHENTIKKEYTIKTEYPNITKEEYNKKIKEINDKIFSLNTKKDFFLGRLKEKDMSQEIKEKYLKNMDETEKELSKYRKEEDSIYKLYKQR